MLQLRVAVLLAIAAVFAGATRGAETPSLVVNRMIESKNFAGNKVGTPASRKLSIYLPPGYDESSTRYPVIYFLASPFDDIFGENHAQAVFDRAIASGEIGKFILASVDMTTPVGFSWAANSPATGNWEDFFVSEVVPYIDSNFRTVASRDSRVGRCELG